MAWVSPAMTEAAPNDERRNFIGSRATPKRLCLGRVGRRRRCSPICRSQRAAEQESVRVFASFPHSVLDSEAPSIKKFSGAVRIGFFVSAGRIVLNANRDFLHLAS